jgi:hypothetical protein
MVQVPTLGPADKVVGRNFTDPEQIPYDINTIRYMTNQVYRFLKNPQLYIELERPIIVHRPDRVNWLYRLVITDPDRLKTAQDLHLVGFLGSKREDANMALGAEFDEILVSEIPDHPGLLCYCTIAQMCGNFSNLVLFADETVKVGWSKSKAHAQAVGKLAPEYYKSVRLYNGILPVGVCDCESMYLTKVKYFDYQEDPNWRAIRQFS